MVTPRRPVEPAARRSTSAPGAGTAPSPRGSGGAIDELAPAAIRRKLDPSLPGVDESVVELEREALPRFQVGFPPQHVTMTLLGDFWDGRTEALPAGALVSLLGAFGHTEAAARVALGRLVARGALVAQRRGRTTWYGQSPHLHSLLRQGHAVTRRFGPPRSGWDGTWSVLTWQVTNRSAAHAHRLRLDLREFGFASSASGVWVSPDPPSTALVALLDATPDLRYVLHSGAREVAARGLGARAAWDLSAIGEQYMAFLATCRPLLRASRGRRFTDEAAFVARMTAVYRWFVIATLDPDLPSELLPRGWPRARAHALFAELVGSLTPRAARHVRAVLASFDPALAALVTTPAPYGGHPPGTSGAP